MLLPEGVGAPNTMLVETKELIIAVEDVEMDCVESLAVGGYFHPPDWCNLFTKRVLCRALADEGS